MRKLLILLALALPLWPQTHVYYSVGQDTATDLKTGTPTADITGGIGTFDVAQTGNIGVGDHVIINGSQHCFISGKTSTTVWSMVTVLGAACADVTDGTVTSIKREFASLNAAVCGATPGSGDASHLNTYDLTSGGGFVLHLFLYYDTGADTTTCANTTGWTTGAANYIDIFVPNDTATQANQTQRHNGAYSATRWRLAVSLNGGNAAAFAESYLRFTGLQFANTHASGQQAVSIGGTGTAANSDIRFEDCIFYDAGSGASGVLRVTSGKVIGRNLVAYGSATAGIYVAVGANTPTVILQNVTFGANGTYGLNVAGGTVSCTNCYSGGNGTADYNGTITFTTSASSDATVRAGVTASIAYTAANFVNVTGGSEDLHLASGASATLLAGGTDLSATFTTDIDGTTRTVPWSIGADELDSVAVRKRVTTTWR